MEEHISFNQANEEVIDHALKFVEAFTTYIDHLPPLLQRKVTRLKEIDASTRSYYDNVERLYYQLVSDNTKVLPNSSKYRTMRKLCEYLGLCQELGDEKLEITEQIRKTIDRKTEEVEKRKEDFISSYNPQWKEELRRKRESAKADHHRANKRSKRRTNNADKLHLDKDKTLTSEQTNGAATSGGSSSLFALMDDFPEEIILNARASSDANGLDNSITSLSNISSISNSKHHNDDTPNKRSDKLQAPSIQATPDTSAVRSVSPAVLTSISDTLSSAGTSSSYLASKSSTSMSSSSRNGGNSSFTGKSTPNSKTSKPTSSSSSHKEHGSAARKKKPKKKPKHSSPRSRSPQGDVPIDPNEPIYCFCKQVSYGSMICCDNKKCRYEWFHFSCVGLKTQPKNNKKWYCSDCQKDRKNRDK